MNKGKIIMFSMGEYTKYRIIGLYRVIKDIDDAAKHNANVMNFAGIKYLELNGYIEEVKHTEINIEFEKL